MAKRSRRQRKQAAEKQTQEQEVTKQPAAAPVEKAPPAPVEPTPFAASSAVDFAEDYYYVYTDLRNVTIIAVVMFGVMFGLGYFI